MKVIFLGSPDFSATILQALINSTHKVVGVVTQPDKPSGRGHKLMPTPVKVIAEKYNIPVYQFTKIRLEGDALKELNADIMVTAAFGQILNQANIDITPYGILNVHGSLLPKYRGSSPIQWAVLNGEKKTGITVMKTDVGIDTGDMLISEELAILPDETAGELFDRMAVLGGKMIVQALDLIESGKAKFIPQDHSQHTYFPMLKKDMGKIDFNKTPQEIVNWCNGLNPWPLAFIQTEEGIVKVFKAKVVDNVDKVNNGTILFADSKNGLIIKCQDGAVSLEEIQAPNSKRMRAKDYLNGRKIKEIL